MTRLLLIGLLSLVPSVSEGASIVTSGEVSVLNLDGFGRWHFIGDGFDISGVHFGGNWSVKNVSPCRDPCTISNSFASVVSFPVRFTFTPGPLFLNAGAGTYTAPFTFAGAVCLSPVPFGVDCRVDWFAMAGAGTLHATYSTAPAPWFGDAATIYNFSEARFVFEPLGGGTAGQTLPVPEPSTLLLTAPALWYLRRKKSIRSVPHGQTARKRRSPHRNEP